MRAGAACLMIAAFLGTGAAGHACSRDIASCLTSGPLETAQSGHWKHVFTTPVYGAQEAFNNCLVYDLKFTGGTQGAGRLESRSGEVLACPMTWEIAANGKVELSYELRGRRLRTAVEIAPYKGADRSLIDCGNRPAQLVITQRLDTAAADLISYCYRWEPEP